MKKIMAVLIIALFMTSLCVFSIPSVKAATEDIQILNYTWYTAQNYGYYATPDDLVVVGEIQNTGTNVIDFVRLEAIAYTTDGQAQAGAYTMAFVRNLLPQQKAPFYIDFSVQTTLSGNLTWLPLLDHVDLRVVLADETTVRQYDGLEVVAKTSYVDANSIFTVVGYLQNVGTQQSGKVWVTGTFYDSSGATIGTGFTNYLANYMAANETLQFSVSPLDVTPEMSSHIASYSLLIQSEEPVATPSPTPSASTSASASPTASPSTSGQPTQSPTPQQESSSTLVTAIAATAVVIAVIVVVALLLKKKPKPQT